MEVLQRFDVTRRLFLEGVGRKIDGFQGNYTQVTPPRIRIDKVAEKLNVELTRILFMKDDKRFATMLLFVKNSVTYVIDTMNILDAANFKLLGKKLRILDNYQDYTYCTDNRKKISQSDLVQKFGDVAKWRLYLVKWSRMQFNPVFTKILCSELQIHQDVNINREHYKFLCKEFFRQCLAECNGDRFVKVVKFDTM